MPIYLCYGFRRHRRSIRIFVILNDLDDAAPDWLSGPATSSATLSQFYLVFDFLPEPWVSEPLRAPRPPGFQNHCAHPGRLGFRTTARTQAAWVKAAVPGRGLHGAPPRVSNSMDDVLMNSRSVVKLLEEYDPEDLASQSRPYAHVADYVVQVYLSMNVVDERARYESRVEKMKDVWFENLRDQLQNGEEIRWYYVVVCEDEARDVRGG
ncbi:hypothetical protein EDB80DRAFT_659664 [Ilyonectria destructans]|nr:hypothetical protein EDB80DRAFT_659664 [Ilyonectria destructans]